MADDKMPPNMDDRPEQTKPEQAGQHPSQAQTSAAATPAKRALPGRKPLFRN